MANATTAADAILPSPSTAWGGAAPHGVTTTAHRLLLPLSRNRRTNGREEEAVVVVQPPPSLVLPME